MVDLPASYAFDGTTACWLADIPVTRDDEWRLRQASFGDGYVQRTLDGINALNMTWHVTFANRTADIINAMVAFLTTNKAKAFVFLDQPTGITYEVFCDKWNVSWEIRRTGGLYYGTLAADFVKANGVGL